MPLECTALFRTPIEFPHSESRKTTPGTGLAANGDVIDFSDPEHVNRRIDNRVVHRQPSRPARNCGFPDAETMTNFVRWRHYFLCVSAGRIWALNWAIMSWSVLAVENEEEFGIVSNSRLDYLMVAPEKDGAVGLMLARTTCELHGYTISEAPMQSAQQKVEIVAMEQSKNNQDFVQCELEIASSDEAESSIESLTESSCLFADSEHSSSFQSSIYSSLPASLRSSICQQSSSSAASVNYDSGHRSSSVESLADSVESVVITKQPVKKIDSGGSMMLCKLCPSLDLSLLSAMVPCGHVACSDCIRKCVLSCRDCPYCGAEISHWVVLKF